MPDSEDSTKPAVPNLPAHVHDAHLSRSQVLDATTVPGRQNIFALAPFPERVNFASQQMRALNLAWALVDAGRLVAGDKVAVIGAGIAGLMTAAALTRRGIEVVVFETSEQLMHIQRYTKSRYVHPTINYWPNVPLTPAADFPFLYWTADVCADVIHLIEKQWRQDFGNCEVKKGEAVVNVQSEDSGVTLRMYGGSIHSFKAAILAVGFGLERAFKGAIAPSYWDDVDLRREDISKKKPFFVSGTGDGGLLEALRIAYNDFEEGQLTERIARWTNRTPLRDAIFRAEESGSKMKSAQAASELERFYLGANVPSDLAAFLDTHLSHLKICVLGRGGTAYLPKSAAVHRLMFAYAVQKGCIKLYDGRLEETETGMEWIEARNGARHTLTGHALVVRHGPKQVIGALLTLEELDALKTKQTTFAPYQYERLFPRSYFDKPFDPAKLTGSEGKNFSAEQALLQERTDVMREKLRTTRASLMKQFPGSTSLVVGTDNGEIVYKMGFEAGTDAFRLDELPSHIFGDRLVGIATEPFKPLFGPLLDPGKGPSPARPMRAGDLIGSDPSLEGSQSGVIGCFMTDTQTKAAFAISARHVFDEYPNADVYVSTSSGKSWSTVGKLDWRRLDNADVAAIRLDDELAFDIDAGSAGGVAKYPFHTLDQMVFRSRRDGSVARGLVSGLAVSVRVSPESFINDAVIVRSDDGLPFATEGDSGSMVRTANGDLLGIVVAGNQREALVVPIGEAVAKMSGTVALASRRGRPILERTVTEDLVYSKQNYPAIAQAIPDLTQAAFVGAGIYAYNEQVLAAINEFQDRPLFVVPALQAASRAELADAMARWVSARPSIATEDKRIVVNFERADTDVLRDGALSLTRGQPVSLSIAIAGIMVANLEDVPLRRFLADDHDRPEQNRYMSIRGGNLLSANIFPSMFVLKGLPSSKNDPAILALQERGEMLAVILDAIFGEFVTLPVAMNLGRRFSNVGLKLEVALASRDQLAAGRASKLEFGTLDGNLF